MAKVNDNNDDCLIGEGSIFEGKFCVKGSIRIEGKFQGDIKTDEHLIIGESGKVKTNITAKNVTIAGTLIGNINASEEVVLVKTGKVLGNIITPRLIVEHGVITEGKVTITSANSGDVKGKIEESYGLDASEAFSDFEKLKSKNKQISEE